MRSSTSGRRKRFPWIPLLALLGTIYLFWVLPHQLGDRPIDVEFTNPK